MRVWTKRGAHWRTDFGEHGATITRTLDRGVWDCSYGSSRVKEFRGTLAEAKAWMETNEAKITETFKARAGKTLDELL